MHGTMTREVEMRITKARFMKMRIESSDVRDYINDRDQGNRRYVVIVGNLLVL